MFSQVPHLPEIEKIIDGIFPPQLRDKEITDAIENAIEGWKVLESVIDFYARNPDFHKIPKTYGMLVCDVFQPGDASKLPSKRIWKSGGSQFAP